MSFIDVKLSDRVTAGFAGGPEWSTLVVQMANGKDRRRQNWSMPRHKFTADYIALDAASQNEVLAAFIAARGQMHTFGFKDWNDFRVREQPLGMGDGTVAPVQLVKTYHFGPASYERRITLPVAPTVWISQNGERVPCEVDRLTGLVTPHVAWVPGVEILANFDFNVRARFAADYFPFTRNYKVAQTSVELVEDPGT